jgi:hypothetical protein
MGCASVSGAQCLSSMCFFGGPPVFCCLRLRLPCTAPTHSSRGHGSISYRVVRLFHQSGVLVTCCPALVVALGIVVPVVVAVYALCVVMATFVPGIMVGVVESSTTWGLHKMICTGLPLHNPMPLPSQLCGATAATT